MRFLRHILLAASLLAFTGGAMMACGPKAAPVKSPEPSDPDPASNSADPCAGGEAGKADPCAAPTDKGNDTPGEKDPEGGW